MLIVSIRDKNGEERRLQFDKEEVTVGRTSSSDIALPRNNISKRHARLVDKDDKVVIVDLRSTNGTYVNGRRITAPEILTPEDKVYIGDFVLRLISADEATSSPPPLDQKPPAPPKVKMHTQPGPPPAPTVNQSGPTESVGGAAAAQHAAAPPSPAPQHAAPSPGPAMEATAALDISKLEGEPGWSDVDIEFDEDPTAGAPSPAHQAAPSPPKPAPAPEPAPAASNDAAKTQLQPPVVMTSPGAGPPASMVVAAAPAPTNAVLAAVPAVTQRLQGIVGGPKAVDKAVTGEKWQGLTTQMARAIDQAAAAGEIPGDLDHELLAATALAEIVGLKPVASLMGDASVSEIFVNSYNAIAVNRAGRSEPVERSYPSAEVLARVVEKVARDVGVNGSLGTGFNGNLPSGESVEAVLPPLSAAGPALVLRRPRHIAVTPHTLSETGAVDDKGLAFLQAAVNERKNIIVIGRAGSGRTTMLNALAYLVPAHERVALVERVQQLKLPHANVVHLDKDSIDRVGDDLSGLLPGLLAQRTLIDEITGRDVAGLVKLALSGHDGIGAVGSARSGHDLLNKMTLALELSAGAKLEERARAMVAATVDVVVRVERGDDGVPKITEILEVEGATPDGFATREVA